LVHKLITTHNSFENLNFKRVKSKNYFRAPSYKTMSADIEKLAVFDGRIIQKRPVYAVEKGALSLTNAPFSAIAQTSSQHTYNIYVPSENVFLDRAIEWGSTCKCQFSVTLAAPLAAGVPLVQYGKDWALPAFPLNSLCATVSATINDTTAVINTQDVLYQVLRLADQKRNRMMRTCPTMLDKYLSYDDAAGAVNNPLAGYDNAVNSEEVPNGAFAQVFYTDGTGAIQAPTSNSIVGGVYVPVPGAAYAIANGVPVAPPAGLAAGTYTVYWGFRSVEKLVLSPFVFSDTHEMDTGFFGLNNIQLIMNLNPSATARLVRTTSRWGKTITANTYQTGANAPFLNSRVNCLFLTPSLDVPLPPKSVVPYMEFPRYLSSPTPVAANSAAQLVSQTITLPQIPDLLIIYARPASYAASQGDWVLPVQYASVDGSSDFSPLTVNFDNFSGLLSSTTAQQLFYMSQKNGLEMDWNEWIGACHQSAGGYGATVAGQQIPLVGGPLILKPGEDITLQSGQAPSLVGNFTLQFSLSVRNPTAAPVDAQLVIITVNSGFFESIRGSSRIIKGVLSEQDIISAPVAPMGSPALERMVGGFSFGSLANIISKAKRVYEQTKPIASAIASALPEEGKLGMVKRGMKAVGYGLASGGLQSGGRRGHRSLEDRLM
jgi:hypothetical protein